MRIVDSAGIIVTGHDGHGNRMEVELKKGTPCTVGVGSDRYADEVVGVSPSGRHVELKKNGVWSKRKNGRYYPVGSGPRSGYGVSFGHAEDYRDPSF